jgi:hypothetical protein
MKTYRMLVNRQHVSHILLFPFRRIGLCRFFARRFRELKRALGIAFHKCPERGCGL